MKFINLSKLKQFLTKMQSSPAGLIPLGFVALILLTYLISKRQDKKVVTYQNQVSSFNKAKTISANNEIYQRKDRIYVNKVQNLEEKLEIITNKVSEYEKQIKSLAKKEKETHKKLEQKLKEAPFLKQEVHPPVRNFNKTKKVKVYEENPGGKKKIDRKRLRKGPGIISFPVKKKTRAKKLGVQIPSGSFVKGKMLTGVEAPEGKTLPVLMQASYAFVGPNKSRVDLSGCFIIAKSTGNLSIERVEMQATKISCVSRSGKMFERPLNGYVADGKDNSFAVMGVVNSKRDRVASMSFLSSVVSGIGKALSKAQTKSTKNEDGATSTEVTGSQADYISGAGANQAASSVTNWYLQHAQGLLPTINIGSGQDVWIIMQESVSLPNWYFKAPEKVADPISFLGKIIH
mgnify:CR=1 FL=1